MPANISDQGDDDGAGRESPPERLAYISDMLGELAEMARGLGERRLELTIREAALQAATLR